MYNTFVNINACRSILYVTLQYVQASEERVENHFLGPFRLPGTVKTLRPIWKRPNTLFIDFQNSAKTVPCRPTYVYTFNIWPVPLQGKLHTVNLSWSQLPVFSALCRSIKTKRGVTSELSSEKNNEPPPPFLIFFLAAVFVCIQGPVRHVWSLQYKRR